MTYHQTKLVCKRINSSGNTEDTVTFNHMSPHCNLDLEDSKDVSFQLTLQFMMMHHDTKFGYERFNCSEDTVMPVIKQHHI